MEKSELTVMRHLEDIRKDIEALNVKIQEAEGQLNRLQASKRDFQMSQEDLDAMNNLKSEIIKMRVQVKEYEFEENRFAIK